MPVGPGQYDDLCTHVREESNARAAIVLIIGGNKGEGFSCQGEPHILMKLPLLLRQVADQIEHQVGDDLAALN